ncbi:hypothetical protein [Streptomyces sp. NPDC091371]|uniref:hypothetical protein n=1 Tax=Streptomyces sp. NPDC091371 TaxID=3155303 RepID=UPI003421D4E7
MAQTLVVIGHGMVGHRLLEALAERDALADPARPGDSGWQVTVLAEEERPAYDRVHLSAAFTGSTGEDLSLVEPGFLERYGVDLRLGARTGGRALAPAARTGTTVSGRCWQPAPTVPDQ